MKSRKLLAVAAVAALLGAAGVRAQPPATKTTPPPHHGLFGHLHPGSMGSRRPGSLATPTSHSRFHPGSMMGHPSSMGGGIIGNKNSHVYHMPGDKGNLPAANNRVYFHSEAEARAAGFHRSGQRGAAAGRTNRMSGAQAGHMNTMHRPSHGGMFHRPTGATTAAPGH